MKKTLLWSMAVAFVAILAVAPALFAADNPVQMVNLHQMLREARATHPQISVAEAKKLMASEKNLLVIDVRTLKEYEAGHVPGAINISRGLLEFRIAKKAPDVNQPILVYCRSGARASFAGQALTKMGYKNVKNMTGGYLAWAKAEKK